jgi:hypothetical protein
MTEQRRRQVQSALPIIGFALQFGILLGTGLYKMGALAERVDGVRAEVTELRRDLLTHVTKP